MQVSTAGVRVAEEVGAGVPEGVPLTRYVGVVALGTVAALAMVVTSTRIGSGVRDAPTTWWFSLHGGVSPWAQVAFYVPTVTFVAAWFLLGRQTRAGGLGPVRRWVVLGAWSIPFLVGPPIFSRDIYAYIVQGLLAHGGHNPYLVGPGALHDPTLFNSIAMVWRHTVSPYGPVFLVVMQLVAAVAGHSTIVQVIIFRLPAMAGLVAVGIFLPRLARRMGADPAMAFWLGVLSPLMLLSFASSGHNDALMLGLLVAGVAVAKDGRFTLGILLVTLAMLVKAPAGLAIAYLLVDRWRSEPTSRRWRVVAEGIGVPVVVSAAVTAAVGDGWGWLRPSTYGIPGKVHVISTPSVAIANALHGLMGSLSVHVASHTVLSGTQAVVELAALAGCAWLWWNTGRFDVVRTTGFALALVVLGSQAFWPWYATWGLVLLAATTLQRSRVLAIVAGVGMLIVGPGGVPELSGWMAYVIAPLELLALQYVLRHGRLVELLEGRRV